jgi:hypothetical protein
MTQPIDQRGEAREEVRHHHVVALDDETLDDLLAVRWRQPLERRQDRGVRLARPDEVMHHHHIARRGGDGAERPPGAVGERLEEIVPVYELGACQRLVKIHTLYAPLPAAIPSTNAARFIARRGYNTRSRHRSAIAGAAAHAAMPLRVHLMQGRT